MTSQEPDPFDLPLIGQHEADPVLPGQAQLGGRLAGCDVVVDLLAGQTVVNITHRGVSGIDRHQLQVLIYREAAWRKADGQP